MIKTKIVETIERYDKDGNLVEKIVREEATEDDETRFPIMNNTPSSEIQYYSYSGEPTQ